jgi:hypothetical protein
MSATASILTDSYSGPVLVGSASEVPATAGDENGPNEVPSLDGNCLRGMAFALGIEAVAGLSLFFIWQIWHLIR